MTLQGQVFRVEATQVGQTLAALLRHWLPRHSWTQVRRLVASRRVLVDGNVCADPARRLRPQQIVHLLPQAAPRRPATDAVRIVYADSDVVVVDKPAGITTLRLPVRSDQARSAKRARQPTLDELVPRLLERQGASGGRVRAVHRLDRDTSGLIVFARSAQAERILGQQFRQHAIHRRYLAIVPGDVPAQTFDTYLVRDRGDGRRGSSQVPGVGKRAVTHVRPLEKLPGYTVLECRLETGRTHQIRIHLAEAGHPICGEKVYRKPLAGPVVPDRSGAPRLALHAAELGFTHPRTGQYLHFESPWPEDLKRFLRRLRRARG